MKQHRRSVSATMLGGAASVLEVPWRPVYFAGRFCGKLPGLLARMKGQVLRRSLAAA